LPYCFVAFICFPFKFKVINRKIGKIVPKNEEKEELKTGGKDSFSELPWTNDDLPLEI
jgi:hypothetical protein